MSETETTVQSAPVNTSESLAPVIEQWAKDNQFKENKVDISFTPETAKLAEQVGKLKNIPTVKAESLLKEEREAKNQTQTETQTTTPTVKTDFDARKLFLEAQKHERAATEKLQQAQQISAKYAAMEEAKSKGDYVAWVKAGGHDIKEFYAGLTQQGLEMEKRVDPIEEMRKSHQAALDEVQSIKQQIATQQENIAISNQINKDIVPLIRSEPDKYETVLQMHGGDINRASVYIFQTAVEAYKQSGKVVPLSVVAEQLENYHAKLIEDGINSVSKLKKFQSRFGTKENSNGATTKLSNQNKTNMTSSKNDQNDDDLEPVITNKNSANSAGSINYSQTSGDDLIDQILKKHGYSR